MKRVLSGSRSARGAFITFPLLVLVIWAVPTICIVWRAWELNEAVNRSIDRIEESGGKVNAQHSRYRGLLIPKSIRPSIVSNVTFRNTHVDDLGCLLPFSDGLVSLSIENCTVDPGQWHFLRSLFDLNKLEIHKTECRGVGKHLRGLNALRRLSLHGCPISDKAVQEMQLRSLNTLSLSGTDITPNVMLGISQFINLTALDLSDTAFADSDQTILFTNLKRLQHLSLNKTQVNDKSLLHLSKMNRLEHLELNDTNVSGKGVRLLINPRLRQLEIKNAKVTSKTVSELRQANPRWTIIH